MPSTIGPLGYMTFRLFEGKADLLINEAPSLLLLEETTGRGFFCEVSTRTLLERLSTSETVGLFVAQILREDAEQLYVFESLEARSYFLALRDLDSVGPKTALSFIWNYGFDGLHVALSKGAKAFVKAPGLGPKTIEKIVHGIQTHKEKFLALNLKSVSNETKSTELVDYKNEDGAPLLVVQALEKLGLKTFEVQKLWKELVHEDSEFINLERTEMLRRLLQGWGRFKATFSSSDART